MTSSLNGMNLEELRQILYGRLGLIIGPSVTFSPRILTDLRDAMAQSFREPIPSSGTYLDVGDALISKGISEDKLREAVNEFFRLQKPSDLSRALVKARWSAILSATLDMHLEEGLQTESDKSPTRRPIAVLNELALPRPPRMIPVFKLLGIQTRIDFPVSTVGFVRRRTDWRRAVPSFIECVKGSPVLCLGMSACDWVMIDLMAEFLAESIATPANLLFLHDDPAGENERLRNLAGARVRMHRVNATLGDFIRFVEKADRKSYAPVLPFSERIDGDLSFLQQHRDLVTVVNSQVTAEIADDQINQLRDILFSPSSMRWDPFVSSLDFPRSVTRNAFDYLVGLLAQEHPTDFACLLTGNAATGKTTVLKRLALDLAKEDVLVLWLKPWFYPDPNRAIRLLFADINRYATKHSSRMLIFIDDPATLEVFDLRQLHTAANNERLNVGLVIGMRTSDWMGTSVVDLFGSLRLEYDDEVPDKFDDMEWDAFPEYLVTLGIYSDVARAKEQCVSVAGRSTRDTLSMLYYLLPATRRTIIGSIQDEYFRLGDTASLKRVLIGETEHATDLLKSAYEMVAVSNHYAVALPIEVLVAALDIEYQEWLDASSPDAPVWGILYADEDDEGGASYRTRNQLVTQAIVEAINGGMLSYSGELRVLSRMIDGCRGRGTSVYREFFIRIVVPYKKIGRLDYADGLRLYESIIGTLPHEDKTLVHHKGLWIKNKGQDPELATKVLTEALDTRVYPHVERGEANEHIYTSLAATVLDAVDLGRKDLSVAKEEVLEHLSKARSRQFFSPRAIHVQAGLILRIVGAMKHKHDADLFTFVNTAVADIDTALLLLRSANMLMGEGRHDEVMLEERREELFHSIADIEDLEREAVELWTKYRSQDGFVLVAQKMYGLARTVRRGSRFKKAADYCSEVREKSVRAGVSVSPSLAAIELLIVYHWRVLEATYSATGREIDWNKLHNLAVETTQRPNLRDNPLYRFIHALVLAHLDEWPKATARFHGLRQSGLPKQILWSPRALLLQPKGGPRHVQGVIKTAGQQSYFYAEDLRMDFYAERRADWPRAGEITHAYIQFAFGGPTAIQNLS